MQKRLLTAAAFALAVVTATPVAAQNREHQQMAAELRILQEQQQQIANTLAQLGEALKALNTRLDDSNNATRKGFADQKLVIDGMGSDMRAIRERVDDTNVRVGTLREEIDALHTAMTTLATSAPAIAPAVDPADPNATAAVPPPAAPLPTATTVPPPAGQSPTRMYEQAFADYAGGQWTLALAGFEGFLRSFPRLQMSDDAQFYIGETYAQQGKFAEAVAAYNAVIQNYPTGDQVPLAYFKRGSAQERLGDADAARVSWEAVVKLFPDSDGGRLAKQRLDGRPAASPTRE